MTRIMTKEVGKALEGGIYHGNMNIIDIQEKVGGFTELVSLPNGIKCWIDEDGHPKKKSLNFFIQAHAEEFEMVAIVGDAVFTGIDEEGNIIDLTRKQEDFLRERFETNGQARNSKGIYQVYEITID